jgi:hypothetical protein
MPQTGLYQHTNDPELVFQFVSGRFSALFPDHQWSWFDRLYVDTCRVFSGGNSDYQRVDGYHSLEHTLQAVVCLMLLIEGRVLARAKPLMSAHDVELALSAAMLHDSGFFRLRGDSIGTAAKYTYCRSIRSCAFAASYLPRWGAKLEDVQTVIGAIDRTGPHLEIGRLHSMGERAVLIGSVLATADSLAQMAASDYVEKLSYLFEEFVESDNFCGIPPELRSYASAAELIERTPGFWENFVRPKLNGEFGGVYRFLAQPYPGGENAYTLQIERNIQAIRNSKKENILAAAGGLDAAV